MKAQFAITQLERARAGGEMPPERFQLANVDPLSGPELVGLSQRMNHRAWLHDDEVVKKLGLTYDRRPRFLGVDQGDLVGLALWDQIERDFLWMTTVGFWRSVLATLEMVSPLHDVIVVEDPGMNRFMHRLSDHDTVRTSGRKGQSVGSVVEKTALYVELMRGLGYCVITKPPRNTKLDARAWQVMTGASDVWTAPMMASSHARDAGALVGRLEGRLQTFRKKADLVGR